MIGQACAGAARIAANLGIVDAASPALTGAEIDALGEAAFAEAARKTSVYARVASAHKLRIVDALQADGNIVAPAWCWSPANCKSCCGAAGVDEGCASTSRRTLSNRTWPTIRVVENPTHDTDEPCCGLARSKTLLPETRYLNNAMVVGPLVLPYALLLAFATVALTLYIGHRSARKAGIDVEAVVWHAVLVGLLVARLAFVWEFRSAYFASPLSTLDIRDGGWNATAGFVGAWLFALSREARLPALRKPLRSALLVGTATWTVGTVALSVWPDTGQELPALRFTSLEGRPVNLAEFKGKPTVVNLWATWCPPCVREMPVLHQAQVDRPGVNFVFLNQGESAEKVGAWLQARQLPMSNVLMDANRQAAAAFKQGALPTTLFFDAKGRLVSRRIGELSAATLAERLQPLMP
jgi:thiol-disulfide isomerase/thioredoxin